MTAETSPVEVAERLEALADEAGALGDYCKNAQYKLISVTLHKAKSGLRQAASLLRDRADNQASPPPPQGPWRVMTPEEYAALPLKGRHMVQRDWDGCGGVAVWMDPFGPPSAGDTDLRERVARIIEPNAWAVRDTHPSEMGVTISRSLRASVLIEHSTAKADAIIALFPLLNRVAELEAENARMMAAIAEVRAKARIINQMAPDEPGSVWWRRLDDELDEALSARSLLPQGGAK